MTRYLRDLGAAVAVVVAVGGFATSIAAGAEFHSEKENTAISAGQTTQHTFQVNTGGVICSSAAFSGLQLPTTASTVSVVPSYSGCEFEGLFAVAVNTNGCDFVFHASSTTEGTVDIATCGTNPFIQVGSTATCRVRVPEQTGLGKVSYQQDGNKVLVTLNLVGIVYDEFGLFCADKGGANGTYTGSSLVSGFSGGVQVKIFI